METSHTITTYDKKTEEATEVELSEVIKTHLEEGNIDKNYLETTLTEIGNEQNISTKEYADLLGQVMLNLTNSSSLNGSTLADTISGFDTHSWVQNEFIYNVVIPLIEGLAETPTDGRNEKAVELCQIMINALQEDDRSTLVADK